MEPLAVPHPATIRENDIRRAHQRGALENDWLQARFSFSFADYHDPNHMHWGSLRALNDDLVAPAHGFGWHGHHDIEMLSYPIRGNLRHSDNLGNDFVVGPGDVLRLSAGSGIEHTEMNASPRASTRFIQIWLYPRRRGVQPSCERVHIGAASMRDCWRVIASPDGREGSATIVQEALVFASHPSHGSSLRYELAEHRLGYLHVVCGAVRVDASTTLQAGDGLRFSHPEPLTVVAGSPDAEVLLFDL